MLTITGSRKTLCDEISRRDLLHVGGLGLCGLPLRGWFQLREAQAETLGGAPATSGGRA
ncbi:MAG: hypothetical protein AB7O26_18880 [Planctomycetaceae bacterium]